MARIRSREFDIERELVACVHSIGDPEAVENAGYVDGLRRAVSATLDYILRTIEQGAETAPTLPSAVAAQTSLAVRNGVSLDTILRRCAAGHALLLDLMIEEAGDLPVPSAEFKAAVGLSSTALDQILEMVSAEYAREEARVRSGRRCGRTDLVVKLLKGSPCDPSQLGYEFDAWHTAVIAYGPRVAQPIATLLRPPDCRLLLVEPEPNVAWAWFGSSEKVNPAELIPRAAAPEWGATIAFGEPAAGRGGWRLSHEQADVAITVARRGTCSVARYAGIGLIAAVAKNRTLVDSLKAMYLAPLSGSRDDGESIKRTLEAYFTAGRNITSAAAALRINRQTVKNRLDLAEQRLGFRLAECALELELAVRLERWFAIDAHQDADLPAQ